MLVGAPVGVVRAPQGSPAQSRWSPDKQDYRVPMHAVILARLHADGLVEYVSGDEDMVQRAIKGPKVRITEAGIDECERIAQAIYDQHGV